MRYYEIVGKTIYREEIQPDLLKKQTRVASIVNNLAANDKPKPTKEELAIALIQYGDLKKRRNKQYAQKLKQQAKIATDFT